MAKGNDIKKISITAVLCALAYLCMFAFKFKVSFLTFDFKDAILAVIAFLYGPVYGGVSALVVALCEFVSVSDTGIYGLIMNFISSASFAITCGMIYKYKRKISGAVMGCLFAVLVMTALMLIANVLITPFYMGAPRETVIKMIPSLLLPFNLLKGIMNAAITIIIYKPITSALKRTGLVTANGSTDKKKFVLLTISAVVVIIIATLIILSLLNGSFTLFK
jgi:riboflavin transporter FmnP